MPEENTIAELCDKAILDLSYVNREDNFLNSKL